MKVIHLKKAEFKAKHDISHKARWYGLWGGCNGRKRKIEDVECLEFLIETAKETGKDIYLAKFEH